MVERRWIWSGCATVGLVVLAAVVPARTWHLPGADRPRHAVVTTDLVDLAARGHWTSGAGDLSWADLSVTERGTVELVDNQPLAIGKRARALKTHPNHVTDGFIEGTMTLPRPVRAGDHFVTDLGFYLDQPSCYSGYVEFSAYVIRPDGEPADLLHVPLAAADGRSKKVDLDLTPFAGATGVRLRVDARGKPTCDWASWWNTAIIRYS
jgi:hypothetical protein